jgi:hypothetical protein
MVYIDLQRASLSAMIGAKVSSSHCCGWHSCIRLCALIYQVSYALTSSPSACVAFVTIVAVAAVASTVDSSVASTSGGNTSSTYNNSVCEATAELKYRKLSSARTTALQHAALLDVGN